MWDDAAPMGDDDRTHGRDRPRLRLAAYTDAEIGERLADLLRGDSPKVRHYWEAQTEHVTDPEALAWIAERIEAGA